MISQTDQLKGSLPCSSFQSVAMFEIYRLSIVNSLSVVLRCNLSISYNVEDPSKDDGCLQMDSIWERRKNMTGVHFSIAVVSQVPLLAKDTNVNTGRL